MFPMFPIQKHIGNISETSNHAGFGGFPMIDPKAPMCARVRVYAHEIIRNIGISETTNIHAGFLFPIPKKHRKHIGNGF